jgi:hypothetical protein
MTLTIKRLNLWEKVEIKANQEAKVDLVDLEDKVGSQVDKVVNQDSSSSRIWAAAAKIKEVMFSYEILELELIHISPLC